MGKDIRKELSFRKCSKESQRKISWSQRQPAAAGRDIPREKRPSNLVETTYAGFFEKQTNKQNRIAVIHRRVKTKLIKGPYLSSCLTCSKQTHSAVWLVFSFSFHDKLNTQKGGCGITSSLYFVIKLKTQQWQWDFTTPKADSGESKHHSCTRSGDLPFSQSNRDPT